MRRRSSSGVFESSKRPATNLQPPGLSRFSKVSEGPIAPLRCAARVDEARCPVTDRSARAAPLTWAGQIRWQMIKLLAVIEVGP